MSKQYNLRGLGANVELGKQGTKIVGSNSSQVAFISNSGNAAVASIAEGTAPTHAVTLEQMQSETDKKIRLYSNVVSYDSGITNLFDVRANTRVVRVTVESETAWTNADSNTNIIVGDGADMDRLFGEFDPECQSADEIDHVYTDQTTIKSRVYQGSAVNGTAQITVMYVGGEVTQAAQEEIDTNTEINIFFDSSGSMNTTLSPLQTMRNNQLRTALEPFYDDDSDAYNTNVTISEVSNERVFDQMRTMGSDSSVTKVINLVFSDENSPYGAAGSYPTDRTSQYDTDIAALRSDISTANSANTTSYYRSVLFQVNTGPGSYTGYKQFTQAVYNGTGNYSSTNGLSDFDGSQVYLNSDVIAGSNATYYANQIIGALNNLGYSLTPLSY